MGFGGLRASCVHMPLNPQIIPPLASDKVDLLLWLREVINKIVKCWGCGRSRRAALKCWYQKI